MTHPTAVSDEKNTLLARTHSKGFTPRHSDADALLDLYLQQHAAASSDARSVDPHVKADLLRALDRIAAAALARGLLRLSLLKGGARRELFTLLARWAVLRADEDDAAFATVLALLDDPDAPSARHVAIALGRAASKLSPTQQRRLRAALLRRLNDRAAAPADVRAWVEALGKLPLPAASDPDADAVAHDTLQVLTRLQAQSFPQVVAAAIETALTRYQRDAVRQAVQPSGPSLALDAPLPDDTQLVLRCRAGLLPMLRHELRERGLLRGALVAADDPADTLRSFSPQTSGLAARLVVKTGQPLSHWLSARLFSSLGFALPVPAPTSATALAQPLSAELLCQIVVAALVAPQSQALLSRLSIGVPRYRLDLQVRCDASVRSLVDRIARAVQAQAPALLNDPIASPWQVEVTGQRLGDLRIELVPRALQTDDPRFAYRRGDVPAASHPPLAAAMARLLLAGPQAVVWDPFVGSGSELIEVALLGRGPRLVGSDLDEPALATARENARAAGVPTAQLVLRRADALTDPPPAVTHIVTNPPMGRRTRPGHLAEFLSAFIAQAARVLPSGGRLVWISPQPNLSQARGREHGLILRSARPVDLHGFWGQLEVWDQPDPSGHAQS
ncbi:MAG: methyltransferase [Myxococcales bacterium]|nr:methyltransferase [Myxococcales bacterium]